MSVKAKEILSKISLEDKARLCSGKNLWDLESVLDLPSIMVADGPHGLRKQVGDSDHLGIAKSVKATCFPTAVGLASSWDDELLYSVGEHLGDECLQEEVSVLLGPGATIKRHPLCGRNFEYFSEDPFLSGKLAKSFINGVQSKGIGTSLKHFVANNQESMRMVVDTFIDERTLREIYLKGFEIAVKEAQPWTVMCSYNKLNGTYLSENKKILQDVLKDEWKHEGLVVTDWNACNDRVEGVKTGQDLEMPGGNQYNTNQIIKAVKSNTLSEDILDSRVERVIDLILKSIPALEKTDKEYDQDLHHEYSRKTATETMVLLKNEDNILPLKPEQSIALIGDFAVNPRYQGSGSSLIRPTKVSNALDAFNKVCGTEVSFARGYNPDRDVIDEELINEAIEVAKDKDVVVLMIGLTEAFESEGFDRTHLNMPSNHLKLVEAVSKVNKNIVVCLSNGSPILLPFKDNVKAILEQYLAGQASGEALVDILYGKVNPSGKLAETFPNSLVEFPSNQNFPGLPRQVEYREGLYIGYRYYDTADIDPLYHFGYGLSYTSFEYSNFKVDNKEDLMISFDITNTGDVEGKEVAQVYISKDHSKIHRPSKELKGYKKVHLLPNETKRVEVVVDKDDLKVYQNSFKLEDGKYTVMVGSSSRNIHLVESFSIGGVELNDEVQTVYSNIDKDFKPTKEDFEILLGTRIPEYPRIKPYNFNSTVGEIQSTFVGRQIKKMIQKRLATMVDDNTDESMLRMLENIVDEQPIRSLVTQSQGTISKTRAEGLIDLMNKRVFRGLYKSIKG